MLVYSWLKQKVLFFLRRGLITASIKQVITFLDLMINLYCLSSRGDVFCLSQLNFFHIKAHEVPAKG